MTHYGLYRHGNNPVWPVVEATDGAELASIAALCGTTTSEVSALPGALHPAFSDETVVQIGGAAGAGRLYAHLTKRAYADSPDHWRTTGQNPSILVAMYEQLSPSLLQELYELSQVSGITTGIIAAPDDTALWRVVLRSAAAATCQGPLGRRIAEYDAVGSPAPLETPSRQRLPASASTAEIRQLFGQGAGLLSVMSHSDGIDAFISAEATLCSVASSLGRPGDQPTYCLETGLCFRKNVPVTEFLASKGYLAPRELRCRILLWAACHGVLCAKVLDSRPSLLAEFLTTPSIGAIVTSWGIIRINQTLITPLAEDIGRGVPLGRALMRFHKRRNTRAAGLRFCLFGDPRMALPPGVPEPRSRNATAPKSRVCPDWPSVGFLRAYLTSALPNVAHREEQLSLGRKALDCVHQLESGGWQGASPADLARGESDLRNCVLDFIERRGPGIVNDWSRLGGRTQSLPAGLCPNCGDTATSTLITLRVAGAARRRLRTCPVCYIVEDAPEHVRLSLRIRDGTVHLDGTLPAQSWSARLLLWCQREAESVALVWPSDASGRPVSEWKPDPGAWPRGAVKASALILVGTEIIVLQALTRRPSASQHDSQRDHAAS